MRSKICNFIPYTQQENVVGKEELYCEAESHLSHHPKSKHQCTRLGSVPNLNSQQAVLLA